MEIIDSFLGKSLKTTIHNTNDNHSEFFRLASSIMADKEFLPRLLDHTNESITDLVNEATKLDDSLKICDNLDAFRIAIPNNKSEKRGYYRILELDRKNKFINIRNFSQSQFEKANRFYTSLELKYKDDEHKDVVFIQSGSIEEVKKAYPNYFGGAHIMINLFHDLRESQHEL